MRLICSRCRSSSKVGLSKDHGQGTVQGHDRLGIFGSFRKVGSQLGENAGFQPGPGLIGEMQVQHRHLGVREAIHDLLECVYGHEATPSINL